MKKTLFFLLIISVALAFCACGKGARSTVNGVKLSEYSIVYSESDLDYAKRAAEFVQAEILERCDLEIPIITDDAEPVSEYEIVIGNTNRDISDRLDADTEGLEFAILAEEKQIALEGDYFIIAAAAYYFVDTYVREAGYEATVPSGVSIHTPIVKEAENFILLIGDGMGVYQTKLFEELPDNSGYSDGEDLFYGYLLPYRGFAKTESLSGVTDSAAAGTALASGYKTYNDRVGINKDGERVTLLPELAHSLGMGTAVMSTETATGATPSAFSSHTLSRDNTSEILECQKNLKLSGTVIDCGFNYYTKDYMTVIERHITDTLDKVDDGESGFFMMYEEAHIDKHSHTNDMQKTYLALIRFNQVIGRFMEYAFYNPDTFILITADHETGALRPNGEGALAYGSEGHTSDDVPVFAYGDGGELFDGKTVENVQIAHTIASFFGVYDFGDQSEYQYLK